MNMQMTGVSLPRDYGVKLRLGSGRSMVVSPMHFAIAQLMLERPASIRRRLRDYAQRHDLAAADVEEDFIRGVKKREGSKNVVNSFGAEVVHNAWLYERTLTADVRSKSGRPAAQHPVSVVVDRAELHRPNYSMPDCTCEDSRWNRTKVGEFSDILCTHVGALLQAVATDNQSRRSAQDNYTGLTPGERPRIVLPFAFLERDADAVERDALLTDLLIRYYRDGESYFTLNREALASPLTYTRGLRNLITREPQEAKFSVVRQQEQRKRRNDLSPSEQRLYAAIKSIEDQIVREIDGREGFYREGVGLEFQGTPFETVAVRYRTGSHVYAICIGDRRPPLVVSKYLMGIRSNWTESYDLRSDDPFVRVGKYQSIDDATRRDCWTEVIAPGQLPNSKVRVPEIALQRYRQLQNADL